MGRKERGEKRIKEKEREEWGREEEFQVESLPNLDLDIDS